MNNQKMLNRFIDEYSDAVKRFDNFADSIDPLDISARQEFAKAMQELQFSTWAAETATTKRHSLLRKVMDEIR